MCANTSKNEKQVLSFSALLAAAFAIGGLVLGLWVGSLVIIFDGVYSLVSLLLTLLSLAASRFIQKPSDAAFPFGRAVIEPIVIAIKASVILLIVSYSLYSAVSALLSGGREVDTSVATLFGIINVLGCGYAWWYIARKNKRFSTGLINAEVSQWKMDTLLSIAVAAGFALAWLVSLSSLNAYAVYADPLMMCLMSFYFIKVPLMMLRDATRELMMMRPSKEICAQVGKQVRAVSNEAEQNIELTRMTKVGNELRVNVDIHTENASSIAIDDIEKTRRSLQRRLSTMPFELQLSLNIAR